MGAENGHSSESRYELLLTHDVVTGEFEIQGAKRNVVVAVGMLEYALTLVRRMDALN